MGMPEENKNWGGDMPAADWGKEMPAADWRGDMPTGDATATDAMMMGFRQMDSNGNGGVDYGEYLKHSSGGFEVELGSELEKSMRMGFGMQDANRDGEISEDEFRMMMGMTTAAATPAMPAMPAPSVC